MNKTRIAGCELSLLGPLAILATSIAITFANKPLPPYPLAAALIGVLLCWRWGIKGAIGSSALLIGSIFLSSPDSFWNTFWLITVVFSLALGLAITALASEETASQSVLQTQTQEHLQQYAKRLEDNRALLQDLLVSEQQQLKVRTEELEHQNAEVSLAREKLKNCSDQLHKEKKSHEFARALIKEQQQSLKEIGSQVEALSRQKKGLEAELVQCQQSGEKSLKQEKNQVEQYQNMLAQHKGELQRAVDEANAMRHELEQVKHKAAELTKQQQTFNSEKFELEQQNTLLAHKLETNRVARVSEGLYQQLKQQFKEKSAELDKTRQELFNAQEQLHALQRNWDELQLNQQCVQPDFDQYIQKLDKEYEAMTKQFSSEIEELQDLVSALIASKGAP